MTKQYQDFVIPKLNKWAKKGHRIVLLTLVHIDGSSPYPVGSQMLVRSDGKSHGMITGGCIESALIAQAENCLANNTNLTERYGKGSKYIDLQLPCGSGLDIFFDTAPDINTTQQIERSIQQRQAASLFIQTAKLDYNKHYLPKSRIVLAGSGSIYNAFKKLAKHANFEIQEYDDNQAQTLFDQWSAAISLFHDHDQEINLLFNAIHSNSFYIGALGSKQAHHTRCKVLQKKGASEDAIGRIFSPIGLNIGSKTPTEIAISVLAQIVQVRAQLSNTAS